MSSIDRILEHALAGNRISLEDCITLYESDEIEKKWAMPLTRLC